MFVGLKPQYACHLVSRIYNQIYMGQTSMINMLAMDLHPKAHVLCI